MASARSACSHHQLSKHSSSAELLRISAAAGNVQEVVRLLGEGAKIMSDEIGSNALHLAASAGHANVVAALILSGCDVNALDSAGCTALQRAASQGHVTVVKQLLKHGADVNHQDNVHGNSALHEASWKGYSQTVAALCKGRAQLQLKNRGGFAALHLCCQNGHNQSCRELLFAGCNPDVQNNYGDTSLHTSARYGHAGVTRILISAQCRVSDQNKNGDTALHISAAMGRKKLTRILLEAGCDKSLRNKQNETARDIATRKDLKEILVILNTPPVTLKSQSENKKKTSHRSHKKCEAEENKCQDKDHNDRKREKNGSGTSSKESNSQRKEKKHKNAHKVHFGKACAATTGRQWSPYGCHYYPDPESFPAPNLDSLPDEPLQKGEQYFLDLAGNICKGPVGVGYTCYCAPFFRNVEARLERDKQELKEHIDRAHERLDRKVSSLEQRLSHTVEKERNQCEARSLRLAEWLCREISGCEAPYKCNEKHVNQKLWYGKAGYDIRRTKSLEMLPNEEGLKGESFNKPAISNSDRVDMESPQSDHWNDVPDDNSSFPEVLPNPCDLMLPSGGQCKDRFGSVDSLERVCKGSWKLQRPHQRDESSNDNAASKDDKDDDRSSESSDGEDGICQEVPSSLAMQELRHSECSDIFQDSNSHQVPDYENIVSFDHAIWKKGQEKEISSGAPYGSRNAVYDNLVLKSAPISSDYQAVETDLHNDSGYSTKVYGSSKGPSPSLSGNMDPEGPLPTSIVKAPKFSSIIRCEQQLAKHNYDCFHHFSIDKNDKIGKSRATVMSGFKVKSGIGSGSIV